MPTAKPIFYYNVCNNNDPSLLVFFIPTCEMRNSFVYVETQESYIILSISKKVPFVIVKRFFQKTMATQKDSFSPGGTYFFYNLYLGKYILWGIT